jgi:Potential Queuosine, Q, salvage protein family
MALLEEVRTSCAQVASQARWVRIDREAITDDKFLARIATPAPQESPTELDPVRHYLEGEPADVADYLLALDTINFGSGWFPTLRKRLDGGVPVSGYFTVAWGLADYVRSQHAMDGGWALDAAWLRAVDTRTIAGILGQRPDHELMSLYAQALRELGRFLGTRRALDLVAECGGSAERMAETLAGRNGDARHRRVSPGFGRRRVSPGFGRSSIGGMAMFDDRDFYKRAQIVPADLALAGVASFADLDRLTIFADNLVPHVLRCEGVLVYEETLAARIDAGEILRSGGPEREIRACAVHACELIAEQTGIPPRVLDNRLWNRGQAPEYKAHPRHRCRCVYY